MAAAARSEGRVGSQAAHEMTAACDPTRPSFLSPREARRRQRGESVEKKQLFLVNLCVHGVLCAAPKAPSSLPRSGPVRAAVAPGGTAAAIRDFVACRRWLLRPQSRHAVTGGWPGGALLRALASPRGNDLSRRCRFRRRVCAGAMGISRRPGRAAVCAAGDAGWQLHVLPPHVRARPH